MGGNCHLGRSALPAPHFNSHRWGGLWLRVGCVARFIVADAP
jgi:hypothetical protein